MNKELHQCELCHKNNVPFGHLICGGPVAFICDSCHDIIVEWEKRKELHHKFIARLREEGKHND